MKVARLHRTYQFRLRGEVVHQVPGVVMGAEFIELWVPLKLAGLAERPSLSLPEKLMDLVETGRMEWVEEELRTMPAWAFADARQPFESETLGPPVDATSFRDFYAFEEHVWNARRKRGLDMVPEWYEAPAFYFSNTASII